MKKDLVTHLLFTISFFLLQTVFKNWFDLYYLNFWLGGLLGLLLPDIDYLIYVYILRPQKAISQEATSMIEKRSVFKTWDLLVTSRNQHSDLIFHSAFFQIIFLVFSFLVVTSSSLFGRGMVLAFALHILIDQIMDLVEKGTIKNWFGRLNVSLTNDQERWYVGLHLIALLILGFIF